MDGDSSIPQYDPMTGRLAYSEEDTRKRRKDNVIDEYLDVG